MQGILEPGINPEQTGITFHYTPDGFFRTQWGPSCLLILAIYFSVMDFVKNKSVKSVILLAICLLALYTTQSRGMLLSLVFGISIFPLVWLLFPKEKLDIKSYVIGLMIISLIPLFIIPWFSPEILTALDLTRKGSDALRYMQIMPLLINWSNHLIFGSGFGSTISVVRSEVAPYAFEISILALYMKIGIFGIVCAILILSYFLSRITCGSIHVLDKYKLIIIYIFVFIYFLASNTNPYLSNFFGMFVFYCFVLEFSSSNNLEA